MLNRRSPFNTPREVKLFKGILVKHEDTFGLKEFPFYEKEKPSRFNVDRWVPITEQGKDAISSIKSTKGGWFYAGSSVWYGFENVTRFSRDHSDDYYNLVIIRPITLHRKDAVDIVEQKEEK